MNNVTSLIRVVDGTFFHVRARDVLRQVKMHRITPKRPLLSHVSQLNPSNFLLSLCLEHNKVATYLRNQSTNKFFV